jgi:membrane protein implicated in regulation of membrane protease activity
MMPTTAWWMWAILAAALGLAELHAPGSYLIWIAIGAAVTSAIGAIWDVSFTAQLASFIIACVLSCLTGYFVYRQLNLPVSNDIPLNQRNLEMVGKRGVVCSALLNGHGKVRLGDSVWLAEGPDLGEGTPVVVRSVRGTAVIIEAT